MANGLYASPLHPTRPYGILDIVSGGTRRQQPFQQPELTPEERGEATRYGIMSGIAAGSRSGLAGGILGGILGGKQGRERMILDKYLEQRMNDPDYGSDAMDRLMAQRYGGERYIRPPTERAPGRPMPTETTLRGPKGRLMRQPGFVNPETMEITPHGVPFYPAEDSTRAQTGATRGELADTRTGSEIRAARQWARNFHRSNPKKWNKVWTRRNTQLSAVEKKYLELLTERDPTEDEASYQAWNQELQTIGRVPETTMEIPASGPNFIQDLGQRLWGYGGGVVDRLGAPARPQPQEQDEASKLRQKLIEEGLLTP